MNWQEKLNNWTNFQGLEAYLKTELDNLTKENLEDAFYKDLEFGTGGMRGIIGPGTNRINIYTIRKANLGFSRYLLKNYQNIKEKGVVIAYDNRYYSKTFALESAKVLATQGIKAYLFDSLRPTPELSFAVRYLKACGGIVITASHNPPQYNGYKVYDHNGCQLVPNLADEVIKYVNEIEDVFSIKIASEKELKKQGLIKTIGKEIDFAYINQVKTIQINPHIDKHNLSIVFTPLHGTARELAPRLLKECGYTNLHLVESQCTTAPDFNTVKSPNPENSEAFTLAIELGKRKCADILIATDPDADRLGIAIKNNDDYLLLNGNQTGAIILSYLLSERKKLGLLPKDGIVYNTIVTSNLGAKIAKAYGLEVESTLTGFKFIGEKAEEIADKKTFVFGYEESYGYLIAPFVRDKDSFQSLLICCEAAAYYKAQNKTLVDILKELSETYGYYADTLINIVLSGKTGQEKIVYIINDFRNKHPKVIGERYVTKVEDYLESKTLPKTNVLKFILDDDSWFVLRPSGTEPKLKIYLGVVGKNHEDSSDKINQLKAYIMQRINTLS